ncbi:isoprenoid biosynthesis glyoxalase ElbB [Halosquirtibacter laminarini]|uniref:Isoprenoid biosynthesis glyoxalase ElbB n=1 Tax=Halosquirtibacter laminarini TaxID=3374600 RepID=A0AC61NMP4_9BACT|nr:isoprenoid biosynthesis glyoxalase ElbB [Prolixibacteraceae bacterium]
MKKVAVILSGCGVFDGSEIHEATSTLIALSMRGIEAQCFAPDIPQYHVINHLTGEEMQEDRNVLVESARIARGDIKEIGEFSAETFDAVIFPGGFGVAKNLSTLAFDGAACEVNEDIRKVILWMVQLEKPIGALCISPAMIAKVLPQADVTIGNDPDTVKMIEEMEGVHHRTDNCEVIIDAKYRLVTSPCYMLNASIAEVFQGALNMVDEIIQLWNE